MLSAHVSDPCMTGFLAFRSTPVTAAQKTFAGYDSRSSTAHAEPRVKLCCVSARVHRHTDREETETARQRNISRDVQLFLYLKYTSTIYFSFDKPSDIFFSIFIAAFIYPQSYLHLHYTRLQYFVILIINLIQFSIMSSNILKVQKSR